MRDTSRFRSIPATLSFEPAQAPPQKAHGLDYDLRFLVFKGRDPAFYTSPPDGASKPHPPPTPHPGGRMLPSLILMAVPALLAQAQPPEPAGADAPSKSRRERMLEVYRSEARGYTIYRDATRREEARLLPEPGYTWTNPTGSGGLDGAVFVWTCRGRAEAIATIFAYSPGGRREVIHELHSLSLATVEVSRAGAHDWHPEAAGIE